MRKICFVLFAMVLALPVCAQQKTQGDKTQSLPPDAPTRAQINTLLELTQSRKTMEMALENSKQIMKQAAEDGFRQKVPNPTPKQLEALRGMFDDIVQMPLDEMMDSVIAIYQRHLTKTDVEELIRFYSSPVGQKMLHELPEILQESMQAGADIQRKRMDEINSKIEQRMEQLIDSSDKSTPPKD